MGSSGVTPERNSMCQKQARVKRDIWKNGKKARLSGTERGIYRKKTVSWENHMITESERIVLLS